MKEWQEFTGRNKCPICNRAGHCRQATASGTIICTRNGPPHEMRRASDGHVYWVHGGNGSPPPVERPSACTAPLAPVEVRAEVYAYWLGLLTLSGRHRNELKARKLPDEEIDRRGYRSWPLEGRKRVVESLAERFGADKCQGVPGLYFEEDRWHGAAPPGLLIPVRDAQGRITAFRVRRDDPGEDDARYLWVSSANHKGPSPGAQVHVPLHNGSPRRARCTEGEIKSDVATFLDGLTTISVPGVGTWPLAVPVLKEMGVETVVVSFDADARQNFHVGRAVHEAVQGFQAEGFTVELERWDHQLAKGIDDLLADGHAPELVTGGLVLDVAAGIAAQAEANDPRLARQNGKHANGHDPEQELQQARALTESLDERLRGNRRALYQEEVLAALAVVREQSPGDWEHVRGVLKKHQVEMLPLQRALTRFSSANGTAAAAGNEAAGAPRTAESMLPDCDCPAPSLIIPAGYCLFNDATGELSVDDHGKPHTKRFALAPILITGRLKDAEEGTESLRLAWRREDGWHEVTVDRAAAMNGRKLQETASRGFPIADPNAAEIVGYLHKLEGINRQQLPCARVSARLGWQGRKLESGFLAGRSLILPRGEVVTTINPEEVAPAEWTADLIHFRGADRGDEQIAAGFHPAGSFEAWRQAVSKTTRFPRVLLALYAALATPLLRIFQARNFIIDWSFATSTGKTTTLRLGASCWGNPDEQSDAAALGTWDSSRVWIERASAVLHDLPLILDDTKRAKHPRDVARVLYDVASGRGRGRGSAQGLRSTGTWNTILLSNGEAPAVSFSEDGGTRARVLTLWGLPFGRADDSTAPLVHELDHALRQHFGHAGPRMVQFLLKHQDEWDEWRTEYRRVQAEYLARAGANPVAARLAGYFAVLDLAAGLAHKALELPWAYQDPIDALWESLVAEASEADRAEHALVMVTSWARSHQAEFWGRHEQGALNVRPPSAGWAGRWDAGESWEHVAFLPHRLRSILADLGFEADPVLRTWQDREWLKKRPDGKPLYQARIDRERAWTYAVTRAAIEGAEGGAVPDEGAE
jgi:putative DNA primase/helicase